jgi:hypothetical protein
LKALERSLGLALAFSLCVAGQARGQAEGTAHSGTIKPPKLVKFVPAVYPPDKHQQGITSQVLLSIEIGDDG